MGVGRIFPGTGALFFWGGAKSGEICFLPTQNE